MKKEKLLRKKRDAVYEKSAYAPSAIVQLTDDELQQFSVKQLELMFDIINRTMELSEDLRSFYVLDRNTVVHKWTDKIVSVSNEGEVEEESEAEVLCGPASEIYKKYKKKYKKVCQ